MTSLIAASRKPLLCAVGFAAALLLAPASAQQTPEPATAPAAAPATPPGMPSREQMMAMMFPCGQFQSVEQLADYRMVFRLCAPKANEVSFMSSDVPANPNGGAPMMAFRGLPMTKDDRGLWSVTTDPIPPDTYRYTFRVDGVSVVDPQATTYSEQRAGTTSTFEVKGPEGDYQTYVPNEPHGTVAVIDYWSKTMDMKRRAHIYLPPGYMTNGMKYPVLYLVHGAGDTDDSWTSEGHANYILDNLLAAKKAVPFIIVMPNGHTPDKPGAPMMAILVNQDFGGDLLNDLIPYVDSHFRTIADPEHRAMAGLSMGGAHTLQFGLPHSDTFRYIGLFSIGLMGDEAVTSYDAANGAALDRGAKEFKFVRYYMGKDDFLSQTAEPTKAELEKHGIKVDYVESEGGHTWINWRRYFLDFAPRLFQ